MNSLIFDAHLDLSMNAMEWNRDMRLPLVEIRRRELGMNDKPDRTRNTICLPEMRTARMGLCVATQIARYSGRFSKLPGWSSPEQAWAQTQGQLAWYRAMEECGEMAESTMQLETKFLRLPRPVQFGEQIDGWRVCWLGGWDKARISFFVMVFRQGGAER